MDMPAGKIRTVPIRVKVITCELEIEGEMHTKPGGYFNRITDLLNHGKQKFIPLTNASYRRRNQKKKTSRECLIVRVDTIEALDVLGE